MDKELLGHTPNGLGIALAVVLGNLIDTLVANNALTRDQAAAVLRRSSADLAPKGNMVPVKDAMAIIQKMTAWFPENRPQED